MSALESRQLDLVFGALSNPLRRSILDALAGGERTVVELARPHRVSLNAVSKHIKYLERAGLIQRTIDGSYHHISIDGAALGATHDWMARYAPFWSKNLDSLKAHVEQRQ